jgi:hypothetical protein
MRTIYGGKLLVHGRISNLEAFVNTVIGFRIRQDAQMFLIRS